ncbi:MAG: hypothetical protein LQ344_005327 [Seirophora lacunosa]|nr:MAG: hypothetical protein LQ344_005327 [Seirophora lacunosa]
MRFEKGQAERVYGLVESEYEAEHRLVISMDVAMNGTVLDDSLATTKTPKKSFRPVASASTAPPNPRKLPRPVFIGGFFLGVLTCFGIYTYKAVVVDEGVDPSTFDVSCRYNATAGTFDKDVDFTERWTGIIKLRRELVQQARGHVLEAAVGTGRNSEFYDFDRVKSLTLLDQSKEMVEVAKAKWQKTNADDGPCRFFAQSALEPLPAVVDPEGKQAEPGYDTIVATMSLCSTPLPELFLRNLATGLAPSIHTASRKSTDAEETLRPRILLLEHGRSHYSWLNKVLDVTAPSHALQHGCWWNRDIGQIARESGLKIMDIRRKDFGTTWCLQLELPEEAQGRGRQQWLADTREMMVKSQVDFEQRQSGIGKEMKEKDEVRRREADLEKWRREQRETMKKG